MLRQANKHAFAHTYPRPLTSILVGSAPAFSNAETTSGLCQEAAMCKGVILVGPVWRNGGATASRPSTVCISTRMLAPLPFPGKTLMQMCAHAHTCTHSRTYVCMRTQTRTCTTHAQPQRRTNTDTRHATATAFVFKTTRHILRWGPLSTQATSSLWSFGQTAAVGFGGVYLFFRRRCGR